VDINLISINGNFYGLPTTVVREVLDPVPITPLPFSPEYVDGLVNIGGRVIIQVDLSIQLENAAALPVNSGQLIVIDSGDEHIALHADQALMMVSIADNDIHKVPVDDLQSGVDPNLVAGVFQWQEKSVFNLVVDQLGLQNIEQPLIQQGVEGLVGAIETERDVDDKTEEAGMLENYLVVGAGDERYALLMSCVCFVEDLVDVTPLPQVTNEVVGITYTHEMPLLVLGLGQLMGQNKSAGKKLVIVQYQDFRCALQVDHIYGIQGLESRENHEVLAKDGALSGYLLGDDEHLTGVLNFDALFSSSRLELLRRYLVDDHRHIAKKERVPSRRLLTFNVGQERCAFPLEIVERVVEYQLVEPLPEGGGSHLHGAVQVHGDILPVLDLRIQMGVDPQTTPLTAYVVAGENDNRWALVVDQVYRVVELPETDLEFASSQENNHVEAIGRIDNALLSVMSLKSLTMSISGIDPNIENSAECA